MPHFYINNARDSAAYINNDIYYGETLSTPEGINPSRMLRELADISGIFGASQSSLDNPDNYFKPRMDFVAAIWALARNFGGQGFKLGFNLRLLAEGDPVTETLGEIDQLDQRGFVTSMKVTVPKNWLVRYGTGTATVLITIVAHRGNYPNTAPARHHRANMEQNSIGEVAGETQSAAMDAAFGSTDDPQGLVIERQDVYNSWDVRPTDELLSTLREQVQPFASITVSDDMVQRHRRNRNTPFRVDGTSGSIVPSAAGVVAYLAETGVTGESLITRAREQHRSWLITRFRGRTTDTVREAEERARQQHRNRATEAFTRFRESQMVSDLLIPTLPFVPHGLASSRRWGIEVESGGARGVAAPESWDRKPDGSLRSAWDGYQEVQDFEPYDEEVSDVVPWTDCSNFERHMPHEQYFDAVRNEYLFRIRENFLAASECSECGARTRMVRREPQTITHRAQGDDCGEFVSPILVSMHSNGLEFLTGELSKQPQNDTSGVHVHVEARDLSTKELATLLVGYDMMERFIDASYQRRRRNYCERRPAAGILNLARMLKNREEIPMDLITREQRYVTTNTHSLSRHGTVEFRAMGPVYNYDYLVRWAMFCREMVNLAKAGVTVKQFSQVKKWSDLLALFAKYGKEYLRASVYEMTGETGYQASLSKEGAPLTQDAVNSDLQALLDAGNVAHAAAAASMARLGVAFEEATARLVSVNHELATV